MERDEQKFRAQAHADTIGGEERAALDRAHDAEAQELHLAGFGASIHGYYSQALDEIYWLRAALAHEVSERRADLALKTFPRSRQSPAHAAIERMTAAANGYVDTVYPAPNSSNNTALRDVGADECLTRSAWESEADARRERLRRESTSPSKARRT